MRKLHQPQFKSGTMQGVFGLQWGDEGKGKLVDILAALADIIVRFAGGANAGHTIVVDGKKIVTHLLPSSIMHSGKVGVIGQGVVIIPEILVSEIAGLRQMGITITPQDLRLSGACHLTLPTHKLIDAHIEDLHSGKKVGTTGRGIGPTYADMNHRLGLRTQDILLGEEKFGQMVRSLMQLHLQHFLPANTEFNFVIELQNFVQAAMQLAPYVCEVRPFIQKELERGARVLLEGAQGIGLDPVHGTYPYCTSSFPTVGGALAYLGLDHRYLDHVWGVVKAYTTRVGEGPFPTELLDETGGGLRERGHEFGATTGRPRRCGWLDLALVRTACIENGVTDLAVTKLDVLDGLPEIQVSVAYKQFSDERVYYWPTEKWPNAVAYCTPDYRQLPGWPSTKNAISLDELPRAAHAYLKYIEHQLNRPCFRPRLSLISLGPERDQTLMV